MRNQSVSEEDPVRFDAVDLHANFDWRLVKGVVTPVKNQGYCGSCWAFSATGALEGAYALKVRKHTETFSFSESQLVDCAGEEFGCHGCRGGMHGGVFSYYKQFSPMLEEDYPYHGPGTCKFDSTKAIDVKISSVQNVRGYEPEQMKAAIAQEPISVIVYSSSLEFQ